MNIKSATLFGFGKIVLGLLVPVLRHSLKAEVPLICCVRASKHWLNLREQHSEIISNITSDLGIEVDSVRWIFNNPNESFSEFVQRCYELQLFGIWILENNSTIEDIIKNSIVLGTSVGVEALNDLLDTIDSVNRKEITVYAFENQPNIIQQIADKHKNIRVIHCPIDRVVTSRDFDDYNGIVYVQLGKDPSESIMIYDIDRVWQKILNTSIKSPITLTNDCSILNMTLKRKLYAKNVVHKLICQMAVRRKDHNEIRDKSLVDVVTPHDLKYMKVIKPALILAASINILSAWSKSSLEAYRDLYNDLSEYFDSSLSTVATDPMDTIGRIIHLDSPISAEQDRIRLINTLKELKFALSEPGAYEIVNFLTQELGTKDIKLLLKHMDDIHELLNNT